MDHSDEDAHLLYLMGNSIVHGCTADKIDLHMDASYAGIAMRRQINNTIPQARATLMMLVAARKGDNEESIRVAEALKRYGADVDCPDSVIQSTPLNVAADFGKSRFVQWLVDRGARIDHHPRITPTIPVYLTCQNNHPKCTAILVRAAMDQNKVKTLNVKNLYGSTPGHVCMQRGYAECLGALAMGGADLRQAFSMYYSSPGSPVGEDAFNIDPEPDIQPQSSMMQALLSFTTLQCAQCQTFSPKLDQCSQCRLAQYCSRECQRANWEFHKNCCKKLRKGQDLVDRNSSGPPSPPKQPFGFTRKFSGDDFQTHCAENEDPDRPVWEYNAGSRGKPDWRRYPIRIEESLESLMKLGSPRHMYRPGNAEVEGMYEVGRSAKPPPNVSTNYVYYSDMLERDFYTGAIRAVRRNGSRARPDQSDSLF